MIQPIIVHIAQGKEYLDQRQSFAVLINGHATFFSIRQMFYGLGNKQ